MLAVVGPTAGGKSELSLRLADRFDAEILSVDSMQVYRGMDVGTAKPSWEERQQVPHHMLDLVEPEEEYSVATFQRRGRAVIEAVHARGRNVLVVGGSGLHFRALLDPLEFPGHDPTVRQTVEALEPDVARAELLAADPGAGDHVDLENPRRVARALEVVRIGGGTPSERAGSPAAVAVREYRPLIPFTGVVIDPGDGLGTRARRRIDKMLKRGLVAEVERLAPRLGRTASQAVGYKELLPVVEGRLPLSAGAADVLTATLALARRQRTFFGRDPRLHPIPWVSVVDQRLAAVEEAFGA
ncbi:MAG: tRNA (adenosine(37)-N6)-dimethylallyltransferase MiaA [Acidimicrobiia bacterium]